MSEGSVRLATVDDASRIAEIHVKTWQHAYKGQMPEEYLQNLSVEHRRLSWVQILSEDVSQKKVFVAEEDGKIIGFSMAGPSQDEDTNGHAGEVYASYIEPDYMGKGYGSKLLEKMIMFLRQQNYTYATLWVLSSNNQARRFYEKRGWVAEEKVKVDQRENFELHETRYRINFI